MDGVKDGSPSPGSTTLSSVGQLPLSATRSVLDCCGVMFLSNIKLFVTK